MTRCAPIVAATLRVPPGSPMIAPEAAIRSASLLPARTRSSRHVPGPAAAAHAMNRKEAVVHFCRRPSKALRHQHASGGFKQPRDSLRSSNLIGSALHLCVAALLVQVHVCLRRYLRPSKAKTASAKSVCTRLPSSNFTSYVPSHLSLKIVPGYMTPSPCRCRCAAHSSFTDSALADHRAKRQAALTICGSVCRLHYTASSGALFELAKQLDFKHRQLHPRQGALALGAVGLWDRHQIVLARAASDIAARVVATAAPVAAAAAADVVVAVLNTICGACAGQKAGRTDISRRSAFAAKRRRLWLIWCPNQLGTRRGSERSRNSSSRRRTSSRRSYPCSHANRQTERAC